MTKTRIIAALCLLHLGIGFEDDRVMAQGDAGLAGETPPGLLATEPETVEEHFEAALVMLRVERPDLAQRYLNSMLEMQPDDQALLRLREKYGTATFLRLSRNEELLPGSRQLLSRVENAAENQLKDPAYFDSLLARLHGSPHEREAAISDLKHFGTDAIPRILARLGDEADFADRDLLLYVLVKFGPVAIDPLLGAIDASDPRTRAVAVETLGWLGDEAVIPRLWPVALAADEVAATRQAALQAIARIRFDDPQATDRLDTVGGTHEILHAALQHFRGEFPWVAGRDGTVDLWSWDADQNRLIRAETTPSEASMILAERLAQDASLLAPENDLYRALFLAASLARSRLHAGWDQPLPEGPETPYGRVVSSGADLAEFALGLAIEHGNAAAAEAAVTALGKVGTGDNLRARGDRPSSLIAALDFPNDRVQFAAAASVLERSPVTGFPRSQRVIEILARSLRAEFGPRCIVVDPNTNRAVDTASMFKHLGYNTTIAVTGKRGFREAVAHGDVALVALHPNTIRWELTQTIANLRADARTAATPIVIAAPQAARADMLRVLRRVPVSAFVATDGNSSRWPRQLEPALGQTHAPPLTPEQRQQRMQAAASWLRHIAQGTPAGVFDLTAAEDALSEAAAQPVIGADAIAALGGIGRTSVQRRFVDIVLAPAVEPELRAAAADQLAAHIERFSRLLTRDSVFALIDAQHHETNSAVIAALSRVLEKLHVVPPAAAPQP